MKSGSPVAPAHRCARPQIDPATGRCGENSDGVIGKTFSLLTSAVAFDHQVPVIGVNELREVALEVSSGSTHDLQMRSY